MSEYDNDNSDEAQNDMIACPDCHHQVPQTNWTLHRLTCNRRNTMTTSPPREVRNSQNPSSSLYYTTHSNLADMNSGPNANLNTDDDDQTREVAGIRRRRTTASRSSDIRTQRFTPETPSNVNATSSSSTMTQMTSPDVLDVHDVVNLLDDEMDVDVIIDDDDEVQIISANENNNNSSTIAAVTTTTARTNLDRDSNANNENQWSCDRCTLINSSTRDMCEACQNPNPSIINMNNINAGRRQSSRSRLRQTLIHSDNRNRREHRYFHHDGMQNRLSLTPLPSSSETAYIGGGALLGGIIGGARALLRGHSVGTGAVEGAFTGAVGGALYTGLRRELSSPHWNDDNQNDENVEGHDVIQILDSPMSVQEQRGGRRRNNGNAYSRLWNRNSSMSEEEMFNFLIQHHHARHHMQNNHPNINVDQMSYEELLQMFGDGTEHIRGATQQTIQSLPTHTIENVEAEFPKEFRSCCICLEEYKNDDKLRRLPCFHSFHIQCVDRWLSANASCPICKHELPT